MVDGNMHQCHKCHFYLKPKNVYLTLKKKKCLTYFNNRCIAFRNEHSVLNSDQLLFNYSQPPKETENKQKKALKQSTVINIIII